eukprot:1915204-Pyramimonas_sp.AAC.1
MSENIPSAEPQSRAAETNPPRPNVRNNVTKLSCTTTQRTSSLLDCKLKLTTTTQRTSLLDCKLKRTTTTTTTQRRRKQFGGECIGREIQLLKAASRRRGGGI